jgi:hypothetical protein
MITVPPIFIACYSWLRSLHLIEVFDYVSVGIFS